MNRAVLLLLASWTSIVGCSYDFSGIASTDDTHPFSTAATDTSDTVSSTVDTASFTDSESTSASASATASGSESATESETSSDRSLGLHYFEFVAFEYDYELHEIRVGPSTSISPEDGSWTVVADAMDLGDFPASFDWEAGFLPDLSSYSGNTIRIAFRYAAQNGDQWLLDDLCISRSLVQGSPGTCLWSESFDSAVWPSLPSGWITAPGASNDPSSPDWILEIEEWHSNPASVTLPYSKVYRADRYLISPPIVLP